MATAKHRAIDLLRRNARLERKHEELSYELEAQQEMAVPKLDAALDDAIGDDLLSLIFTALPPRPPHGSAGAAHASAWSGGLTTEEIARAFLIPELSRRERHRAGQTDARRGAQSRSRFPREAGARRPVWPRCSG